MTVRVYQLFLLKLRICVGYMLALVICICTVYARKYGNSTGGIDVHNIKYRVTDMLCV